MDVVKPLLEWYYQHKRDLPWRDLQDPYRIWLSEIMLQQTRIQQVFEYYERFVSLWGDVFELAEASEEQVLKAWEGLGYYTRAKNLHRTAKIIAYEYQGKFPNTYQALEKLPGIGAYTARAIASFAFGQPVVALDGNAFRVITRLLDLDLAINLPKNQKKIQALADNLLQGNPSKDFNYALMDLGNVICKPQCPACEACPLQRVCIAFQNQSQNHRPVKLKTLQRSEDFLLYFWVRNGQQVAIVKNMEGYWKGLYLLPYQKVDAALWQATHQNVMLQLKHLLTHKDLWIKVIQAETLPSCEQAVEWVSFETLFSKPFPKPFQKFLQRYL